MKFVNEAQEAAYQRVAALLRELYGRSAVAVEEAPAFLLRNGSAITQVEVLPIGSNSLVRVLSVLIRDVEPSAELYELLIRENAQQTLGAFAMEGNDVLFLIAVPGEELTETVLEAAVGVISQTADRYDDEILQRFGGRRAVD